MKTLTFLFILVLSLSIACSTSGKKEVKKTMETTQEVTAKAQTKLSVEGMSCSENCVKAIETKLSTLPGVQSASVDFDTKTVTVLSEDASSESLIAAISEINDGQYTATLFVEKVEEQVVTTEETPAPNEEEKK